MEDDARISEYNSTMVVSKLSPPHNFADYGHIEKKIMIHQRPLGEQKKMLIQAFIWNDKNYIYEFDKETLFRRKKIFEKIWGLGIAFVLYYGFSGAFYWKKIRIRTDLHLMTKYLLFLSLSTLPLIYFGYHGIKTYYDLDQFLYNKYLKK